MRARRLVSPHNSPRKDALTPSSAGALGRLVGPDFDVWAASRWHAGAAQSATSRSFDRARPCFALPCLWCPVSRHLGHLWPHVAIIGDGGCSEHPPAPLIP